MPPQSVVAWSSFESVVAKMYRLLGAREVQQNVSLGGHQIDIYVEEETTSGQTIRIAVECKFYNKPLGTNVITQVGLLGQFLTKAGLVDKVALVAYMGFSKEALFAAQAAQLDLVTFADLEIKVSRLKRTKGFVTDKDIIQQIIRKAEKEELPDRFPKEVFVLMPFLPVLDDLYIYGISGCAEKLGLRCKRADDIEHNGDILQEILDHIKRSEFIIAEMSDKNPNVFYEVGWAHSAGREPILLTREGTIFPFDLQGKNHIIYKSIHDLEEKLTRRFKALIDNH